MGWKWESGTDEFSARLNDDEDQRNFENKATWEIIGKIMKIFLVHVYVIPHTFEINDKQQRQGI